ncbi:AAA family ATPase [Chitinophaga sp. SYP-B3965]|uniref:AAA family ATPase n=1 Tax=Chitinophaga sp. SYP-B3965 TaxID=2663120 RepID=UPI001299A4C6|nr:AAA family ATPase [Chitinophaga sp. SYP-B3965]MRG46946.1 AAA family ATPase [Chitinophaga sp. SYP-B3965]
MYIKNIVIQNIGPIGKINYDFSFNEQGAPKPVIIVGKNGSGKSIFISHIVNTMLGSKNGIYEGEEVNAGKVYKFRSPQYVSTGKSFSYSKVTLSNNLQMTEWVLLNKRPEIENVLIEEALDDSWRNIDENENTHLQGSFVDNRAMTEQFLSKNALLYFPANRFEEPAWLNIGDIVSHTTTFTERTNINGKSDRRMICHSPLRINKSWLLDIALDMEIYERQIITEMTSPKNGEKITFPVPIFGGYAGRATTLLEMANLILKTSFSDEVRFGIGHRVNRNLSVMKGDKVLIPNASQLSSGETTVLNLFVSILRDFDLTGAEFNSTSEITGIVVIDEIDLHLHTHHQYEVLPKLISLFPKVQFIITTHSPLFILGLEKILSKDNFEIISCPDGAAISSEKFSEFGEAYKAFFETEKFQEDLNNRLARINKPTLFVEGEHDLIYLNKAATLLNKQNILDRFSIEQVGGESNLDKIWNIFDNHVNSLGTNQKIVLLYDCDVIRVNDAQRNKLFRRRVPFIAQNPIEKGVENLFDTRTITKLESANPAFIDFKGETTLKVRGVTEVIPEKKSINKNEKTNVAKWLDQYGDAEDFKFFDPIFKILEDIDNVNV